MIIPNAAILNNHSKLSEDSEGRARRFIAPRFATREKGERQSNSNVTKSGGSDNNPDNDQFARRHFRYISSAQITEAEASVPRI
jgi:hypothetical protein